MVLTIEAVPCVAVVVVLPAGVAVDVGGRNVYDVGEGKALLVVIFVMLIVVIFCSWPESRVKLGVGWSVLEFEFEVGLLGLLELELGLEEGCCFLVEFARETEVEGGREDLERIEEVEGALEARREMAGDAGAWRVEEGVSTVLLVPLLAGSEK